MSIPDLILDRAAPTDSIAARFLEQGGQSSSDIAGLIARFIDGATRSLDLAIYDCHLKPETAAIIRSAFDRARKRGVAVRLVYDDGNAKPQNEREFNQTGADFVVPDTHERVDELGLPPEQIRAVRGIGLMHQKFMVRDDDVIWNGSMNWSDDSMSRMENTLVTFHSPPLAAYFRTDFEQLWTSGNSTDSGNFRTNPDRLIYAGTGADLDVDFSPGQGEYINAMVARRIRKARHRIVLCSMLINSSQVLSAILDVLNSRQIQLWGVYDRTQMDGVLDQWQGQPQLQWKIDAIDQIMRGAEMIGKRSVPWHPGRSHNFMHNKMLVVDDTVIVGSYNLSHAAQANSENMMAIDSPQFAERAIAYVAHLRDRYLHDPTGVEDISLPIDHIHPR